MLSHVFIVVLLRKGTSDLKKRGDTVLTVKVRYPEREEILGKIGERISHDRLNGLRIKTNIFSTVSGKDF